MATWFVITMELDHSIELHDSMAFFFTIRERMPTDNTSKASGLYEFTFTIYGKANNLEETFKIARMILDKQQELGRIPTEFGTGLPNEFETFALKKQK